MSTSTFSGPVLSGTVREGATRNVGAMLLSQTYNIPTADILLAPPTRTAFYLPAGSKIIDVTVELPAALATATNASLTVGKLGGTANFYYTTFSTGATATRTAQATVQAAQVVAETNNVGTSDVGVTLTATAVTGNASAGNIQVTVLYMQRNPNGTITYTP